MLNESKESLLMNENDQYSSLAWKWLKDQKEEEVDKEYDYYYGSDSDNDYDSGDDLQHNNHHHPTGNSVESATNQPYVPYVSKVLLVYLEGTKNHFFGRVNEYWNQLGSAAVFLLRDKKGTLKLDDTKSNYHDVNSVKSYRSDNCSHDSLPIIYDALSGIKLEVASVITTSSPHIDSIIEALNCFTGYFNINLSTLNDYMTLGRNKSSGKGCILIGTCNATTSSSDDSESFGQSSHQLTSHEVSIIQSLGLRIPEDLPDNSFYTDLQLNVESLKDCKFLRVYPSLVKLQLNVNEIKSFQGLENLINLQDITAKDNAITDLTALQSLLVLVNVRLDDNNLTSEAIVSLGNMSNLQTLSLKRNKLSYIPVLTGCCNLQKLELYQNHITDVSVESLKVLSSLTLLDLGVCVYCYYNIIFLKSISLPLYSTIIKLLFFIIYITT